MSSEQVDVTYTTTEQERILRVERGDRGVALIQPRQGYGMIVVRRLGDGTELERYYGFDMALDHAAAYLDVSPADIDVPAVAEEMGI